MHLSLSPPTTSRPSSVFILAAVFMLAMTLVLTLITLDAQSQTLADRCIVFEDALPVTGGRMLEVGHLYYDVFAFDDALGGWWLTSGVPVEMHQAYRLELVNQAEFADDFADPSAPVEVVFEVDSYEVQHITETRWNVEYEAHILCALGQGTAVPHPEPATFEVDQVIHAVVEAANLAPLVIGCAERLTGSDVQESDEPTSQVSDGGIAERTGDLNIEDLLDPLRPPGEESAVDVDAPPETLRPSEIGPAVRRGSREFGVCHDSLGLPEGEVSSWDVELVVERDGSVSSAETDGEGAECVEAVFLGLQFPKFTGPAERFMYPLRVR